MKTSDYFDDNHFRFTVLAPRTVQRTPVYKGFSPNCDRYQKTMGERDGLTFSNYSIFILPQISK